MPPEATTKHQVEHRLVFHYFRGRNEHAQDHARLAAVHDVVSVVAGVGGFCSTLHQGGIGVGGAYKKVCLAFVVTAGDFTLRASYPRDPVTVFGVSSEQILSTLFGG